MNASNPGVRPLIVGPTAALANVIVPVPESLVVCGAQAVDATFAGVVPETRWAVRAATVRGPDRAQCGENSQDVFGVRWSRRRGSLLVAVADGLGSMPGSGPVARRAVRVGLTELDHGDRRPEENIAAAFTTAAADLAGRDVDGDTTLVLAELVPEDAGCRLYCTAIGDSSVWTVNESGWRPWIHSGTMQRATTTLRTPDAHQRLGGTIPDDAVLVFATDGFGNALGNGHSELAAELYQCWSTPPSPVEFLNQVSFLDQSFVDDRTVVVVWPDPEAG